MTHCQVPSGWRAAPVLWPGDQCGCKADLGEAPRAAVDAPVREAVAARYPQAGLDLGQDLARINAIPRIPAGPVGVDYARESTFDGRLGNRSSA